MRSLKRRWLPNLVLLLNTICNLQQLRMFFNKFLDLFLVCKDIEPRYGRSSTRGFYSTVRVVSVTTCMLFINLLNHLFINFQGSHILRRFLLDKLIQCVI